MIAVTDQESLQEIIITALADLRHRSKVKRETVFSWFISLDEREDSFLWTCAALDVDAGKIRSLAEQSVTRRIIQNLGGHQKRLSFRFHTGSLNRCGISLQGKK